MAQLVSVRVWGACGRQFESGHPDNLIELSVRHLGRLMVAFEKHENQAESVQMCPNVSKNMCKTCASRI